MSTVKFSMRLASLQTAVTTLAISSLFLAGTVQKSYAESTPTPAPTMDCSEFSDDSNEAYVCRAANRGTTIMQPKVEKLTLEVAQDLALDPNNPKKKTAWRGSTTAETRKASGADTSAAMASFVDCQRPHKHTFVEMILPPKDRDNFSTITYVDSDKEDMPKREPFGLVWNKDYCERVTNSVITPTSSPWVSLALMRPQPIGMCIALDFYCICCHYRGFEVDCNLCPMIKYAYEIEYFYPAYKIDTSEELFQSLYLSKQQVSQAIAKNEATDEKLMGPVFDPIDLVQKKVSDAAKLLPKDKTVNYGKPKQYNRKDAQALAMVTYDALQKARTGALKDMAYQGAHSARVYGRTLFEGLNDLSVGGGGGLFSSKGALARIGLGKGLPHQSKKHFYAMDLPMGYASVRSLLLTGKLINSDEVRDVKKAWRAFLGPTGEFNCARNDIFSGKTRTGVQDVGVGKGGALGGLLRRGRKDNNDQCLSDIGEAIPVNDARRLHITDASYQGAERTLVLLHALMSTDDEHKKHHSYLKNVDKWNVVRPNSFRSESSAKITKGPYEGDEPTTCAPMEDMTRVNTTYTKANMKEPGSGGESTFEIFPAFKGCWGYRGRERDWFTFMFDFGDSALSELTENDDFRLR